MKQVPIHLLVSFLLAGALASASSLCAGDSNGKVQEKAVAKETPQKGSPKRDWYSFGGTVASVDKRANTISLKKKQGERVLKLDSKSTLEINDKPAGLGGVRVGDYAHGKLHKDSAGNEVILDAKFAKEAPKKVTDTLEKGAPKTPAPIAKP
jgi:hypothetical protein